MNKQFFYSRKEPLELIEGEEQQYKTFRDSFSLDLIIRSMELEDGRRIVLLNDIHERNQEVPVVNKNRQVTGYRKEKMVVQSEIYLDKEDNERFVKLNDL